MASRRVGGRHLSIFFARGAVALLVNVNPCSPSATPVTSSFMVRPSAELESVAVPRDLPTPSAETALIST